jgi:hypothetical protein
MNASQPAPANARASETSIFESATRDLLALPSRLVRQGGPSLVDHELFRDWLHRTSGLVSAGRVPREKVTDFWRSLGPEYLAGCAQGFALAKPHGYAGDYEIMDKIYRQEVSPDPRFRGWDLFFHAQSAPTAVRNRVPCLAAFLERALPRALSQRGRVAAPGSAVRSGARRGVGGARPHRCEPLLAPSGPERTPHLSHGPQRARPLRPHVDTASAP